MIFKGDGQVVARPDHYRKSSNRMSWIRRRCLPRPSALTRVISGGTFEPRNTVVVYLSSDESAGIVRVVIVEELVRTRITSSLFGVGADKTTELE